MSFFRKILEKPWLPADERIVQLHTGTFTTYNRKVALIVFLCVVASVFFLLFAATHMRLAMATDWVPMPEPPLLWLNSIVLVFVSLALELTKRAAHDMNLRRMQQYFIASGVLTVLFVALQLVVWKQLLDLGYAAARNPANAFFYVLTAAHAVHLLGGLIAWWRALRKMQNSEPDSFQIRSSVDLCAIYWHFLLFIWIAMVALFIST